MEGNTCTESSRVSKVLYKGGLEAEGEAKSRKMDKTPWPKYPQLLDLVSEEEAGK